MRFALLTLVLTVMVTASIARNSLWRDDGAIWTDSLERSGTKARGYNELGIHLLATGNYVDANRILTRSLVLDPYQPTIYVNLGTVLEHLSRIDEAMRAYEQAIRLQPDDPTAFYNLGILYYNVLHDRERSLTYLLRARQLDPLEPDVHLYLGRIYEDKGDMARSHDEIARYRYLKP